MTEHIPFRPSNADHGYAFEMAWCERCQRDRRYRESDGNKPGCRILALTNAFGITDPQYPKEWRQDGPEGPRCTAFTPEKDPGPRKSPVPRRDDNAAIKDMFS